MSKFKKGENRPENAGRKKGTPNKTTAQSREIISDLVESKIENLNDWIDEIYKEEGALVAFKCLATLLEYHVPKLSRIDNQNLSNNIRPIIIVDNIPREALV